MPVKECSFAVEIPMLSIFRRLMKNEHGATAIEYTLIAVAAITAFTSVGNKVNAVMSNVANTMT
jgi:pilus assembly protein Flp/PilA